MAKAWAVILAAGLGKRMKSRKPKPLHEVVGVPMVRHVLNAAMAAGVEKAIVVTGYLGDAIEAELGSEVIFARQREYLGTGDAVRTSLEFIPPGVNTLLVLCGDTPLLREATLAGLLKNHKGAATILTMRSGNSRGYGRIVRNVRGQVEKVVEEADAGPEELAINELNSGVYVFNRNNLESALAAVAPHNKQGEYYLTDVLQILRHGGHEVNAISLVDYQEALGVNSRVDLARVEKIMQCRILEHLMEQGVSIIDPATTFVEAGVEVGEDTVIHPFTILRGATRVGEECELGPGLTLQDTLFGNRVRASQAVAVSAQADDDCVIGPYAYLRPGTHMERDAKIGTFVEVKKSLVGQGSKVPHLTYLGDATLGKGVNVGAGTITCNFDGKNKWPTKVGDGVFIGSNTNLVAPVSVADGAYIGAGSTITRDVPAGSLAVERANQVHIKDWAVKKGFNGE